MMAFHLGFLLGDAVIPESIEGVDLFLVNVDLVVVKSAMLA